MNQIRINRKSAVILFLLIALIPCCKVLAAPQDLAKVENPDLRQGIELFIQARKAFYNVETPFTEVQKMLDTSRQSIEKTPDGCEKYYRLAQIEFILGEMAEYPGDKKMAAEHFTESNRLSRQSLEENPKSSEANRILADTIMRLMPYKGSLYMMSQGPQALKLLKTALNLNPQNYTAMNSLGTYYLNAPAIGGGSVEKGIQILQQALESKDEFNNFISNVWLGIACRKKNNHREADDYFQKALKIYPNSPWVKGLLRCS